MIPAFWLPIVGCGSFFLGVLITCVLVAGRERW